MDRHGETQNRNQYARVLIVGGGISGLSAAYYAQKIFREKGVPVNITLVEKSEELGGKIQTLHRDGFVIEKGPDSFLARKLPIIHLTREIGLEGELTATNPEAKKNYILYKGRLHRMPPGLVLGIPTEIAPFLKTGLVSPLGKLRAALDLVLPRRKETGDESLGQFLRRRLGSEVAENIAEPLLSGIYAGDTDSLSIRATFPQFPGLEQKYRSLILGMMASRKNSQEHQQSQELPSVAKNSMFLTYKKGLTTLVNRLVEVSHDVKFVTGQGVARLQKQETGYAAVLEDGSRIDADVVIMASPSFVTANLLSDVPEVKLLEKISYVSVANIVMAFDGGQIDFPLDGSGFVVPRKEGRNITACTWTSSKWLHTAPKGKVLLRVYVGRSGQEDLVDLPDKELLQKARTDLLDIMGIRAEPQFYEITRLMRSMPQYPVGHLENLRKIREALAAAKPGLFLCGAAYQGVGIPDCVRQGKEAAEQALAFITRFEK